MGPLDIPNQEYDLNGSTQQSDTQPILLLSTERSGSNLVRSILNAHPEITAPHPPETAFPWRNIASPEDLSAEQRRKLVRDILINKRYSHHPLVEALDIDAIAERINRADPKSFMTVHEALYAEYADVTDSSAWVSKDPSIWDYIEELREYYDDIKIVYLVRDARDVVLSFKNSNAGQYHPYFNAQRWAAEQGRGQELLDSELGESMFQLQYEQLLQNPESVVESLCEFLELEYAPEMLYYYDTDDAQEAAGSAAAFENLSVPIKSDNFGKFHDGLTGAEVKITEKLAGEELEAFNYELTTSEREREEFEFDVERYEERDRTLTRIAAYEDWLGQTDEKVRRYTGRSFSTYMILRYGLLA
ncbi:sulfotransferase family protein [Halorubrum sp. ASP1]|uniref:sulfotransferase family protein n=1 Tax=Halorubrum sp. ASP1 TaxID=2518114 RepID=UPI001305083F|nr:sulfotransferase [Halorubrum sp. ASP1]